MIETPGGVGSVGLSRIESAVDSSNNHGNVVQHSVMDKSLKLQERELKRIMQSQKSLKNATKSIVKLMKVHDHTS